MLGDQILHERRNCVQARDCALGKVVWTKANNSIETIEAELRARISDRLLMNCYIAQRDLHFLQMS
jgi:hypothetical protein